MIICPIATTVHNTTTAISPNKFVGHRRRYNNINIADTPVKYNNCSMIDPGYRANKKNPINNTAQAFMASNAGTFLFTMQMYEK